MLETTDKICRCSAHAIFILLAILILLTFRQYGITWDEELQSQYGQAVVDYYLSGFQDHRYAQIFNLYIYGGMFDGLASIFDRFTPFRVYETRHLLNAIFGLIGLWGSWRLARYIGGSVVGLLALILIVLTPVYYGHMFNNPKDIPFAAGIVWTLYFMSRAMGSLPHPKWSLLIKLSVILGLTLGIRVGGVMVLLFWLAPLGLIALRPLWSGINKETALKTLKNSAHIAWRIVLPVLLIAYAVMLICWPWAQQDPIINPLKALSEFSNFPQDVEVLLDGITYRSTQLPWTYVPLYFAIELSELVLFLLAAGLLLMPWILRRLGKDERQSLFLVVLMAFMPMLYAVTRHPALYDAVRHFLFAVPLICIIAAVAARFIFLWAINEFRQVWSRRLIGAALLSILLISAVTQIAIMFSLHPYEYIYANRFTGGVPGAYGRYELDYWGTSFKEAAEQIQTLVNQEGGVPPGRIYRVAICGPWDAAMIYLPPDYEPVVANEPAEFFLSTTRWMCQNMRPGKEVIRIERMNTPLAIVKDLRGGYEYYPGNKKPDVR